VRDVTEQYQIREQLNRLAFEDVLTGLPNRRGFEQHLQQAIDAGTGADDAVVTVLFVDLDRFKAVNDSFGHRCGDAVLVAIAERLRSVIQDLDVPTRYAGDEFLVLLQHESSCANSSLLAESIRAAVAQPVPWNGTVVYVTASVGIVHYQTLSGTAQDCLAQADAAMYRAKSVGRNTVVVFDAHMRQEVARSQRMEAELRQAITTDEIQLFYQPVCDALTSEIVSFEALARWLHPADGVRAAGVFIPLAEDRGIIVPLGYRMIQVACVDIARTTQTSSALRHIPIQVNISYHQLAMPGFVSQVRELVRHYEIPPGRLRFEMTETALITDAELAGNLLRQLLEIGISTVMDDFGVGYSSLSYLNSFAIDYLKIDRSFVQGLAPHPSELALCEAMIVMAHKLGIKVIAEGVETEAPLQFMKQLGCQQFQGFIKSPALDVVSFESMMDAARPAAKLTASAPARVKAKPEA
jgi:diguanylate cyclase (GGDEF)-like protein